MRRKGLPYFPARNIEREIVTQNGECYFRQEMLRHLHRSKERLTKCASGGHQKSEPARSAQPRPYKNCTTIVVLPSPRSLFSSIERRLNCRYPSAARQRNQSRLKQTITTPIQDESIRQPNADVNSLSTFTRPSAGSLEAIASNTFKNHLKSLIDLLLVPCRPLVDPLYVSYWF